MRTEIVANCNGVLTEEIIQPSPQETLPIELPSIFKETPEGEVRYSFGVLTDQTTTQEQILITAAIWAVSPRNKVVIGFRDRWKEDYLQDLFLSHLGQRYGDFITLVDLNKSDPEQENLKTLLESKVTQAV